MANVYAVKTGNWSDVTVWNTGALPAAVDNVFSNNFTVTVDGTFTVASISNLASSPAVTGGGFVFANGGDLTANISLSSAWGGTNLGYLLGFTLAAPATATFRGNVTVTTSVARSIIINNSSGSLTVIGNISGMPGAGYIVGNNLNGTVSIIGNTTYTRSNSGGYAIGNLGLGSINVTGNVTTTGAGGQLANGMCPIINSGGGNISITGSVTSDNTTTMPQIYNTSGTVILTGSANNAYTIDNRSTFYHYGTATAGSNAPSVYSSGGINYLTGPFIGTAQGVSAIYALQWRWVPSVGSSYMTVPNSTATGYKNLFTADNTSSASGQPAVTNVRSGTVYGPNSELTGTCAVPTAGSVALGVPVDNTTGTAILTQQNVLDAATTALTAASAVTFNQSITTLTTPNSIGERLKNAATVATVSQQISDVFSSRQ